MFLIERIYLRRYQALKMKNWKKEIFEIIENGFGNRDKFISLLIMSNLRLSHFILSYAAKNCFIYCHAK